MGRRGPLGKPDHLRQRKNKTPAPVQLPTAASSAENVVPPLPPCAKTPEPGDGLGPTKKASSTQRGYGVEHQKWRAEVLAKHPRCVDCGQRATEADHIIPVSKGGEQLVIENGCGRCKKCHAEKTARDQRHYATALQGDWHPMVVEWWASVWRSPMASEYQDADMKGGLFQLATLYQDFWTADSPGKRLASAAEIRLQEVRFGLSPADRSRLRWAIEQGETAAERTEARREKKKVPKQFKDPRGVLKAI